MGSIIQTIFGNASVAGIPLLAFVMGLVQWVKGFGLKGNQIRVAAMLIGILFGIGYQFSTTTLADFSSWFAAIVFGIALGLVASGLYDTVNQ